MRREERNRRASPRVAERRARRETAFREEPKIRFRARTHLYRHAVPGIQRSALTALSCVSVFRGCSVFRSHTTNLASMAPDAANGRANAQSRLRLFGQAESSVRVTLYRDNHAWCARVALKPERV